MPLLFARPCGKAEVAEFNNNRGVSAPFADRITAFAFCIFFRLVHTLGSVGTTAQAYLRVPVGVATGAYFLSERLSETAWIGLICVVLGVAAMTLPGRKPASLHRPA